MLTICWAAKGGSGTTTFVATAGLHLRAPALLVDLAGELPVVLGLAEASGAGVHDWLVSDAGPERLDRLTLPVRDALGLLPAGGTRAHPASTRWDDLAQALRGERAVIVDAGTGPPPPALAAAADRSLLVTRPCYLSLRRAVALGARPTGIVLVRETGHALRAADVEHALGAPVVTTVDVDPMVSRAVDAGLLTTSLPRTARAALGGVA